MEKPLVSVLMVTYNRATTLKETIASVLDQTYKNIQFIIVDDGSTDDSADVIHSFSDDRIELYTLENNRHICYATNYGFSKVKGDYLARIDSDDLWYPEKLEKQLDFFRKNEKYKVCFTWLDLIDENGVNINEKEKSLFELYQAKFEGQTDALWQFFLHGNALATPSVLMETEVLRNVGGYAPGYMQSHDFDYWIRIAKKYPIYVMQERLIAVRRFNETNATDNNSNTSYINSVRFYNECLDIKKHFFDDMSDELFAETFKKEFVNKEAKTHEEYECEKAFLLCRPILENTATPAVGIEKFFELLSVPVIKDVLEEKYGFIEKSLYELTGKNLYFDYLIENDLRVLKQQLMLKEREVEAQRMEIDSYRHSTSWKITAPLRKITSILKRN